MSTDNFPRDQSPSRVRVGISRSLPGSPTRDSVNTPVPTGDPTTYFPPGVVPDPWVTREGRQAGLNSQVGSNSIGVSHGSGAGLAGNPGWAGNPFTMGLPGLGEGRPTAGAVAQAQRPQESFRYWRCPYGRARFTSRGAPRRCLVAMFRYAKHFLGRLNFLKGKAL